MRVIIDGTMLLITTDCFWISLEYLFIILAHMSKAYIDGIKCCNTDRKRQDTITSGRLRRSYLE